MSTLFKDNNIVFPMPSHSDTGSRLFGRTFGKTSFQSGLESRDCDGLGMQFRSNNDLENIPDQRSTTSVFGRRTSFQNRLNQDMRSAGHVNMPKVSRPFGLQSRNSSVSSSLHQEGDLRMNKIINGAHQRSNISTVSKTFGLISDDLSDVIPQNNGRYDQEMRRSGCSNSSVMPRVGLHSRTSDLESFSQGISRVNQDTNLTSYRSTRTFLGAENFSRLTSLDNDGFNEEWKKKSGVNSSVLMRQNGLQSRNLTPNPEVGLRLNEVSAIRNTTGFNMNENSRYNYGVIDNGGFRRPMLTRDIRGRCSTLMSRLYQNQNTKRNCKDLSNTYSFNVSQISMRDIDSQSDSRVAINGRNNWKSNQSVNGSVLSVTSVKSQFMNLLENLHHSILNVGHHETAEAIGMEFERAKQKLENICEMSFAPSVSENCEMPVISQSSNYTCPPVTEPISNNSYANPLKSSKELLKTLISSKNNFQSKFKFSTYAKEDGEKSQCDDSVFKKPKPYKTNNKKRKSSRILKVASPEAGKSSKSPASNKAIKLKQWYPIAFGSNLAFCGFDEAGEAVKTDAVKKRLSNRKMELINGLCCNLIGSPSTMVSVLPKKIKTQLKNGITVRWKILQKELLNCQTVEEETTKRLSKSVVEIISPYEKNVKTPVGKTAKNKSKTPKVTSTPKKKLRVAELHTRSGRTVKPPSMFWIAATNTDFYSTKDSTNLDIIQKSSEKERNSVLNTPVKKSRTRPESPKKTRKKSVEASPKKKPVPKSPRRQNKKTELGKERVSPAKNKKANESFKSSKKETTKERSFKKSKKKESEDEEVNSFIKDSKGGNEDVKSRGKRKRDVNGDGESVQAKKSKIEKKSVTEVESVKKTSQTTSKSEKKTKRELKLAVPSSKPKSKKSRSKKKKETVKKESQNISDVKELSGFEENSELKLDDIVIPEIARVSGNPQLSRSQLRIIGMETPPLKYFNKHLDLLRSTTPGMSPSWCISQRTESEVKQFQKRREEALKIKVKTNTKKTVIKETRKNVQNKDVKKVMEWMAEKTVRSPEWSSAVLQYVIPSRKQLEERMNNEEDEEVETESF